MKKTKRIAALCLGGALALSGCLFAACTPDGGKNGGLTVAEKTVDALRGQNTGSLTLDGTLKLATGSYSSSSYKLNEIAIQATANPADGDGDILWHNKTDREYRYAFIRDWEFFSAGTDAPVEDLSSLQYGHDCNVLEYFDLGKFFYGPEGDEQLLAPKYVKYIAELFRFAASGASAGELAKTGLNMANAELFALAEATGAVKEQDGKVNIDLYKIAEQVKADALALAQSVNEKTTAKDLLLSDTFRKYAEKLTQTVRVDEVPNLLVKVFSEFQKDFDGWVSLTDIQKIRDLIAIKPNIQSTAYEYMVKILTSDEAKYLLNSIFGISFDCDQAIWTQTDFSDYAEFTREGMSKIIEVINSLTVTRTSATFSYSVVSLTVTDAIVEYTISEDNTVSVLYVSGGFAWRENDTYYEGEAAGTLIFSNTKAALANVITP